MIIVGQLQSQFLLQIPAAEQMFLFVTENQRREAVMVSKVYFIKKFGNAI